MRSVLLDAGPQIALFATDDRHHARFDGLVSELSEAGLLLMTTDVADFSRYRLPDGRAFSLL